MGALAVHWVALVSAVQLLREGGCGGILAPARPLHHVGYQEELVGDNIACGPKSAEEVVQGWLDSPRHCEDIMGPRFAEMGIAYAPGRASRRGLYWVLLLADPRGLAVRRY